MRRISRHLLPILRLFLEGNRAMLLAGAGLSLVTALCGVALLGLSGWFVTATALAGLSAATALAFDIFAPSAGIRFLALARTAGRYGERLATHDATLAVLAGLRERLFRGWARPGAAGGLAKRPSRLLFRLTLDIDALDSLYLRVLVPLIAALGVALAAGFALAWMDIRLGLAVAALLAACGLALPLVAARAADRPARRRAHALEILRARVIDLVAGQAEWIMAGTLGRRIEGIAAAERRLCESDDRLNRIETWTGVGFGVAGAALLAAMLVAVALLAEARAIGAPVAALGLMIGLAALEPFAGLRRGALELGRTLLAARRIAPRLDAASDAGPLRPPGDGPAVRLAGVSVRHPGAAAPSLGSVTFTARPGEKVALVGPSGAGKSTLLALLAGEAEAETGRAEAQAATLLTQRTELFSDSLRGNLLLADPRADDDALWAALEAAGFRTDVEALPRGLDTPLGEGGQGLSGGQARRLALARLFLRDTPVWLLDEPTEGLDGETARDVLRRLDAKAGKRCVIVATHVGREAALADRLVAIENGRIVSDCRRESPAFAAALAGLRPD